MSKSKTIKRDESPSSEPDQVGSAPPSTSLKPAMTSTSYEAGSYVGGLWKYENDNGRSQAYRHLCTQTTPAHQDQFQRLRLFTLTPPCG